MDKVYIIEGWFGSDEWVESVWADRDEAIAEEQRLWVSRTSEHSGKPADHAKGLHKFAAVEHEVRRNG